MPEDALGPACTRHGSHLSVQSADRAGDGRRRRSDVERSHRPNRTPPRGQCRACSSCSSAATTATDVLQLYKTNLNKFFIKRDSPLPIGLFVRAFGYHWPDAGQLVEPLIDYAFSSSILKNRKYLAISLLKNLVRNSAALASLDRPVLIKQIETLLNNSQRVGNQEEKYKEYIQKSIPLQTTHSSSFPFLYSIFKDFLFSSFFL